MNNTSYTFWKETLSGTPDGETLEKMNSAEISDAFSSNISFGTGGLRGVMGLGTNRINTYTVRRVTCGLAKTILLSDKPRAVAVAYDTRHNSSTLAQEVCATLSAFGIAVHVFDKAMPTPALSFAVRHLGLGWGVVLTASHNPQEYNGYKVYNNQGVQVTDSMANEITKNINTVEFFEQIPDPQPNLITIIDEKTSDAYERQIISFLGGTRIRAPKDFIIVYSALHGAGANSVPSVLEKMGFEIICTQQNPDGSFGGIKTPNPEEPIVYTQALAAAEQHGAKLILATDPDCDRVGVMVRTKNGFEPLTGNQIGALLIDYLVKTRGVKPGDTVITTIVSGMLGELVAKASGLGFKRLLTGFKYIGDYAEHLPTDKSFFFGYEESYGFLAGDGARDKDAVIASALIAQMAAHYTQEGLTLLDQWIQLSQTHGYCLESLYSMNIPISNQKAIMTKLRANFSIDGMTKLEDFSTGFDDLPPADVLKLHFSDGSWAAVRPSGTEPKIKLYTGVCADTIGKAKSKLEVLNKKLLPILDV